MKKILLPLLLLFLPFLSVAQELVEKTIDQKIDAAFGKATGWFVNFIFYQIPFGENVSVYWVLFPLILGAVYFTFYFKFINFTGFFRAINVVRGKYDEIEKTRAVETEESKITVDGDNPDTIRVEEHDGEVSHFQALTAALSATVGLGNIAGVAIALSIGGAGATFWMIVAGFLGMASKFVECTLGVKYRDIDENGVVYGGPMYYLSKGLKSIGLGGLGKGLAVAFAIMCIGGSFGGGNMFQVNQAFQLVENITTKQVASVSESMVGNTVLYNGTKQKITEIGTEGLVLNEAGVASTVTTAEFLDSARSIPLNNKGWLFGLVMSILVGIVIIGGIKSIAKVTDKIVPFMVAIYVLASLWVLGSNFGMIGDAFGQIIDGAFSPKGVLGGAVGVLIQGFRRAAFSNEAGIGSAAIAHSAVKTKYAASEGLVALLEPFIDTVVVCTMTALVLIITGSLGAASAGMNDAQAILLTSSAFESSISWFPWVLTVAVVLFAFSSMISWSYYGFQAWSYLFGRTRKMELLYKGIFCLFVIVGAAASLGSVIGFSDAMIFAMMVPNMIGIVLLAPKVKKELKNFMSAIKGK